MKIVDLSHEIYEGMPVYPGCEGPRLKTANTYATDGFKETVLTMYSHTGTHIDPPAHLLADGATLDSFAAEQFIGKGLVIDCTELDACEEISLCHTGDCIRVIGRLQSRTYIKRTEEGQTERVAYEISALSAQILEQDM